MLDGLLLQPTEPASMDVSFIGLHAGPSPASAPTSPDAAPLVTPRGASPVSTPSGLVEPADATDSGFASNPLSPTMSPKDENGDQADGNDSGVRIYCAYPNCPKHYASQDGVRKHAKRYHADWLAILDREKRRCGTPTPPRPGEERSLPTPKRKRNVVDSEAHRRAAAAVAAHMSVAPFALPAPMSLDGFLLSPPAHGGQRRLAPVGSGVDVAAMHISGDVGLAADQWHSHALGLAASSDVAKAPHKTTASTGGASVLGQSPLFTPLAYFGQATTGTPSPLSLDIVRTGAVGPFNTPHVTPQAKTAPSLLPAFDEGELEQLFGAVLEDEAGATAAPLPRASHPATQAAQRLSAAEVAAEPRRKARQITASGGVFPSTPPISIAGPTTLPDHSHRAEGAQGPASDPIAPLPDFDDPDWHLPAAVLPFDSRLNGLGKDHEPPRMLGLDEDFVIASARGTDHASAEDKADEVEDHHPHGTEGTQWVEQLIVNFGSDEEADVVEMPAPGPAVAVF